MAHGVSPGDAGDLWLCGWRVRSEIVLPELPAWHGDDREPDVTVAIGPVPNDLRPLSGRTRRLQVSQDGRARLGIEGVAAYLVDAHGRHVTIAPAPGADDAGVRAYLLGSVFAILCYKRGLLPLHASAVRIGNSLLAMSGPSRAGKSTLAAALVARGHALASDDVTPVDLDDQTVIARPAFPRLRLSPEAIAGLVLAPPAAAPERSDAKHSYAVSTFVSAPAPLNSLYLLRRRPAGGSARVKTLKGLAAVAALSRVVYRPKLGAAVAGADRVISDVAQLARLVPPRVLEYGSGFETLIRVAADLEECHHTSR
jgi:hypothetical protein